MQKNSKIYLTSCHELISGSIVRKLENQIVKKNITSSFFLHTFLS